MYDRAIQKIGGAFKLTVLLQKRIREIIRGASPMVPVTPEMSPIDIALQEVLEEKIGFAGDLETKSGAESGEAKKEKKAKAKAKKDAD